MAVRSAFFFNCYRYWSSLVLRNRNGTAGIIHIIEGVTQGGPLTMITYGIGILPLIKNLKQEIPSVPQPWYAGNARALDTFVRLETYFDSRTRQEPGRGINLIRPRAY